MKEVGDGGESVFFEFRCGVRVAEGLVDGASNVEHLVWDLEAGVCHGGKLGSPMAQWIAELF